MLYPCPKCEDFSEVIRYGFFITRDDTEEKVQRYRCKVCCLNYSKQTHQADYRMRKRELTQPLFRLLCSGVSQRRAAYILETSRHSVDRRLPLFGRVAAKNLAAYRATRSKVDNVVFDELVTSEHSKCKPVTVPIAVENITRKVLSVDVGILSARGKLKELSLSRYGKIKSQQKATLQRLFKTLTECVAKDAVFSSDKCPLYPPLVAQHFPEAIHLSFKGRRSSVVGQGELKEGERDPLFYLNHTYAMFRDNLKRLSRRTWCTTKSIVQLKQMVTMYAWFHNKKLDFEGKHFELQYEAYTAKSRWALPTINMAS